MVEPTEEVEAGQQPSSSMWSSRGSGVEEGVVYPEGVGVETEPKLARTDVAATAWTSDKGGSITS